MTDTVEKFLNDILKACEGEHYLFRGIPQIYDGADKISSSLYRLAGDGGIVYREKYRPFYREKEILDRAKRHYPDSASNREILTDLRHHHGKTNLIDFSRNLYIGLFFACYGERHAEDGELILLDSAKIEEKPDVVYAELQSSSEPFFIEPANTQFSQKRVASQNSVFVYPPSGYINKDLCEIITVPANLKQPILDHLQKIHDIHIDTIYNDLIGFIANEKNYETASYLSHQGVASLNKGKYEEAIGYYDKLIKLNPNDAEAYNNRGVAKNELGQHHEAIADYDKAIELDPDFAGAYNNRGTAKDELGKHKEAIADYDKVIELKPNDARVYSNRGVAKGSLEQYPEAIADYGKAIELNPSYAEAYNNRGVAKNELGQHREAISDFNKAIELNPVFVEAYHNRGTAKIKLEQHQEAIADYDKVIELKPNDAIAYRNRGDVKNFLGQQQNNMDLILSAIVDYNKAIELDPNNAIAYRNRGIAYQVLGRTQEAAKDFRMALKLRGDEA